MFTPSRNSNRFPVRIRLAVALTLGGVSLVQPAFAGKPYFERKKPHVNVGAVHPRTASRGIPIDSVIHFEFDRANRGQALRQPQRLHTEHFLGLDHTLVNKEFQQSRSGNLSADAQRDVAEANARATIQAAREAADARKRASSQAYHRRLANVVGGDRLNLGQRDELWERSATPRSDMDQAAYFRATMAELDAIDLYYSGEGSWGTGEDVAPYSYSE